MTSQKFVINEGSVHLSDKTMYYLRFVVITMLLINVSCSTHKDNRQVVAPPKAFRQLLKKFKPLTLPLTLNTTGQFSPETFPEITATDTVFIKSPDAPGRCFGLLPDTSRYYGLVWLAPAEVYQVRLSTFTKTGEKIGERALAVGECGDDCGFSCSETLLIHANCSIYSTDSITSSECTDAGLLRPGTTKKYVRMIAGRVQPTGEINLSDVKTVAVAKAK